MNTNKLNIKNEWWRNAVIYQIYPLSFCDSNGDGKGDIRGIISKLEYIKWLGVDAIWLNPIYKSPMFDCGYDINDFMSIDPVFGTMDDFDELLSKSHSLGLKLIMDMTFNHTSDQHPWFLESKSSKDSPKRDWYIWSKGKRGHRPNNWLSAFGGSVWEKDEVSGEYYLHTYSKQQPDLNWQNPEVKKAMFDICKFWYKKGVDGFRMDSAHTLMKASLGRNNPQKFGICEYDLQESKNFQLPSARAIWKEFSNNTRSFPGKLVIGEIDPSGFDKVDREDFYGNGKNELNLVFNFDLNWKIWSANNFRRVVEDWYSKLPREAQPCWVFNNHDIPRSIQRYALIARFARPYRARVLAVLLATLKGTPFIYYGEEIGLQGSVKRSDLVDPLGKKHWPIYKGRDASRTPMQWNGDKEAGFTASSKSWLPVSKKYRTTNVEIEKNNPNSLLCLYKKLLELRKEDECLSCGDYKNASKGFGLWSYYRIYEGKKDLVLINFLLIPRLMYLKENCTQVISSRGVPRKIVRGFVFLYPTEAVVLRVGW